ncbi:hypothetical protein MT340_001350 [Staphylococcus sp. NRL 16/872]|uniref:immunodominant staphylococcal antigen IsaB family protein n=1 Tax=Staphylococcus sp. NRL 16/872 TaxID=2930131 RepID=UPI001FB200BC|nr:MULTISPECIES: hypothetical protein [unclassified Staphylococcus]MCJ1667143.1 hypothetical protein [Staphylococcus sp. NRL 19/737]WEN69624.1 hypothetical protein MT340_001350 [Staphylococcus sp. NRL 16/872]
MNKIVKTIASTTLAFGTLLGVSATVLPVQQTAHAAVKPHYSYNGYIDKDAKFLTDKNFVNAVKHDNVKFSGITLAPTKDTKVVEKYNQKFTGVTKDGKKANKVQFTVKGDLTLNQLNKAYGKDLKKVSGNTNDKTSGMFEYRPVQKGLATTFVVNHGRVVEADISYAGFTTSK